ncbi:Pentatricopeptide repeat-containing protein, mitochondrial, partial [Mucuna pruriens]
MRLRVVCRSNKIDLALRMHDNMKNKDLELDITAYSALLDDFCKVQDMEYACKFFSELLEKFTLEIYFET